MSTWQEQILEAHNEVINDFKSKWRQMNGGPSVIEEAKAFCAAVDWTEWWIILLLTAHALLFTSICIKRKSQGYQAIVFLICMAIIYNAERINKLALQHWKSFSRQNYFLGNGTFTSAVLSAPLLITMFSILIIYLMESFRLLVEMKRKELIYKAKIQAKKNSTTSTGTGTAAAPRRRSSRKTAE